MQDVTMTSILCQNVGNELPNHFAGFHVNRSRDQIFVSIIEIKPDLGTHYSL